MKKQHSRLYYGCLTLTLLIFAQLTLPAFAEADIPDQPAITETDQTGSLPPATQDTPVTDPDNQDPGNTPVPEPADTDPGNTPVPEPSKQDVSDNTPDFGPVLENAESPPDPGPKTENPVSDNSEPGPDPGPEPEQLTAEQNLPPGDPEELPAPSPSEDLTSAQITATSDSPQSAPGNSYRAMVLPENGSALIAGEETKLIATFTELSITAPLASAFLYIPDSLTIVDYSAVEVSEGWGYNWENPGVEESGFSKILSLWATIDSAILRKDQSVSATFTVTTAADQEHHFATSAWQDRATNEAGVGVGPGTAVNNRLLAYSEPRINVAVTSAADLNQVRDNQHWHYLQQNDIDLNGFSSDPGSGSNPDPGWQPIGSNTQPFIGSYNGGGHTIENLTINRPGQEYIGLFARTASTTTLNDINLANVSIIGDRYVGGLVGYNLRGQITNTTVSGDLEAIRTYAGGLAGLNHDGSIINGQAGVNITGTSIIGGISNNYGVNSKIIKSHATGTISGTKETGGLAGRNSGTIECSSFSGIVEATAATDTRAGGLVGYNYSSASICCSFAEATVSAPGGIEVGGLVGENDNSSVLFSYASAIVTGKDNVGGLVGFNTGSNAQVTNSYSLGAVSGSDRIGGLIGLNTAAINSCYSAANVTGDTAVGGLIGLSGGPGASVLNSFYSNSQPQNAFGSAVSDEALKTEATYSGAGWNIATLSNLDLSDPPVYHWYIEAGESYPTLWWQHQPAPEPPIDDGEDGDDEQGDDPDQNPNPGPGPDPAPDPNPGDGGNNTNNSLNPPYYAALTMVPPALQSALSSTAHLVLAGANNTTRKPLIGPGFISSGSWGDLLQAEAAYNRAYTNFIHLTETNPGTTQVLLQLDLSLARAAILVLHQRLGADPALLTAAQQACHQALQLLNQHSHLLTNSQKLQAETILAEILSVLQLANHQ